MRLAIAVLFACTTAALAQAPRPALSSAQLSSIDTFVQAEMQKEQIPGAAVGVFSRGTILLAKGYGLSNVELNVPVKPETIFQSGSVGKQFVSAAIMLLVEQGKLSLDDSVTRYFPDAPACWKPIKIANLLSHTSGLPEYESPDLSGPGGPFYLHLDLSQEELLKRIEALNIEGVAGAEWHYRNTNYVLLGMLIQRLTGQPYQDFLASHIFQPLGMTSTRPISDADIIPNRAAGYELHGTTLKNQDWVSPTFNSTADGTLYFNLPDLAKWDASLYTTTILKQSSLDRMWTVFPLNNGKPNHASYGFAWELDPQNGHRRIEHGGAWQGFTCEISRYPDDSLTVVVLTNLDSGHARPAFIAHVLAGFAEPALGVPKLVAQQDDHPQLAASLRHILDQIIAGKDFHDQVGPELGRLITPDSQKQIQTRLAPLWPGGTLTLVSRRPMESVANLPFSTYRLKKGDQALLISFALDPAGKVINLGFRADSDY